MINLIRRIGFPAFKRSVKQNHKAVRKSFHAEPLEPKQLLAADIGMDFQDPAIMSRYALFHALSRGGDALMQQAGLISANDSLRSSPVSSHHTNAQRVPAVTEPAEPTPNVVHHEMVLSEPVDVLPPQAPIDVSTTEIETQEFAEGAPPEIDTQVGENTFVIYNPDTGEIRVDTTNENLETTLITTLEINSERGIFTGDTPLNLNLGGDGFDVDSDNKIFKLSAGGFGDLTFGEVAQRGHTEEFIFDDLYIQGSAPGVNTNLSSEDVLIEVTIEKNVAAADPIRVGDQFDVVVTVADKHPGPPNPDDAGVFAAYMDINYNTSLASPVGDIQYGSIYPNGQSGTFTTTQIDEVGAFTNATQLSRDPVELFRVTMTATAPGNLTFTSSPADVFPISETLLFSSVDGPVDESRIQHDSASVTIVDSPRDQDLVAFAKALADSGAVFYGASWCPHCTAQKEDFDDGQEFLPFVEVTTYETSETFNDLNQIGIDNNISSFPTWVFGDGSRVEGRQTVEQLSQLSGIPIPLTNVPTLIGLEDTTLLSGSPLHIPLNGWDANGGELTYMVTSDNPDVTSTLITGNRSMLINVAGPGATFGKMLFNVFEDRAPLAAKQILGFAEDGTYDDVIFHRVIDGFVIQGGDPTGTGGGDPNLPDFDDQFHVDLQHNRTGLLSMAKAGDDTNSSQFFITEGPTRHLDFNHTVFGQLVEGEKNREAISNTYTTRKDDTFGGSDSPTTDVTMESVTVFRDSENGMLMLKAPEGEEGVANITVTVMDEEGHSFMQTFAVAVEADTVNGLPFLNEIPELETTANTPFTFNLSGVDVEGDPILFGGEATGDVNFDLTVDSSTGEVTITPPDEFVGILTAEFSARDPNNPNDNRDSVVDYQRDVQITVNPTKPVVDLLVSSDAGLSESDNITNSDILEFDVLNVQDDTTVELFMVTDTGETEIGETTGSSGGVTISVDDLENGTYTIIARQRRSGLSSVNSDPLEVTVDRQDLDPFTSTAPTLARVNAALVYDANHPIESAPHEYSLANAPDGVTIDSQTGELSWTPNDLQVGANNFSIVVTDLAGNTEQQQVTIEVEPDDLVGVRLMITDTMDNPIIAAPPNSNFILNAFVDDLRRQSAGDFGVTSAYFDVEFDSSLVSFDGDIQFSSDYALDRSQDLTTAGLINETGASSATKLGADEILLWSVMMTADAEGSVTFSLNEAEDRDFALADFNDAIDSDNIVFTNATLQIVDFLFAQPDSITVNEDSGTTRIDVTTNDLLAEDSGSISIVGVSTSENGSIDITDDRLSIDYTPNNNFSGIDTFNYTIEDEQDAQAVGMVTVTVTPINDAPVAIADGVSISEDSVDNVLNVLANDIDVDGDDLTITIHTMPSNGTLRLSDNSDSLFYTPNANVFGSDMFQYTISDGSLSSEPASVSINILAENDAPIAVDDSAETNEDTTLIIDGADLIANDDPGANEDDTLTIIRVSGATNGTVSIDVTSQRITFVPNADFNGTATFVYTVEDDAAIPLQDTATVTVTVHSDNDAPIAVDDTATTRQSAGTITLNVLANDSSGPDVNESLTIDRFTTPNQGGSVSIVDNTLRYTPAAGFSGTETFTYTITDRPTGGRESTATVTIEVLNFVPHGVQGMVTFGGSRNFVSNTRVSLEGRDVTGLPVKQEIATGQDGTFHFDEVTAGTYIVSARLPFTLNAQGTSNSMTLDITDAGLGDQLINFDNAYLHPQYAIWEALSSATRDGVYAAVDTVDGQVWSRSLNNWNAEIVDMVFSEGTGGSDVGSLTLTINDGGRQRTATIPADDHARMQVIGHEGSARLVRILGPQSSFFPG